MSINLQRQIDQLWAVAKMYHGLAVRMQPKLTAQLQLKVSEFADQCKDSSYLRKNVKLLRASAHLSSSAIRLYSIEEAKKSSVRWVEYDRIRNLKNWDQVELEVKAKIKNLVHFLLRHMTAHSEDEWKKFKGYRIAYEAMKKVYFDLDYVTIFDAMSVVIGDVKTELGKS